MNKTQITHRQNQEGSSHPHETIQVLKILKALAGNSKNTLAIHRELKNEAGLRNYHAFYRQFRFCLRHRLIELRKVKKKWGIPTKIYHLTEKGEDFLELFKNRANLF